MPDTHQPAAKQDLNFSTRVDTGSVTGKILKLIMIVMILYVIIFL